jgi:hypothetical protein
MTLGSEVSLDLNHLPAPKASMHRDEMAFLINGQVVEYAPYFMAIDPASGKLTSYVPIYYLQQVVKRFGVTASWNGTNLAFSMNQVPATSTSVGTSGTSVSTPTGVSGPYATKMDMLKIVGGYFASLPRSEMSDYGLAGTMSLPSNPGPDPFTDVSASEWPMVKMWMQADNSFGIDSPVTPTRWGSNTPVTTSEVNHFIAQGINITPNNKYPYPTQHVNSYMELSGVDYGIPSSGMLTEANLEQVVTNLEAITRGWREVSPNVYQVLVAPTNSPGVSTAGLEWLQQARFHIEGNEMIATFPGEPDSAAAYTPMILAQTSSDEFSLNGGQTWQSGDQKAPYFGYKGYTSAGASYDSPDHTPSMVMMKGTAEGGFGLVSSEDQDFANIDGSFLPPFACGVNAEGQFGVFFGPIN